jgi:hypothetical protein
MKLEVGMYIRTELYSISKIIDMEDLEWIETDKNKGYLIHRDTILKASNKIIDLIEVGDIITYEFPTGLGMLKYENVTVLPELLNVLKNGENNHEYTILSIVTKEQFESMQYKVD